MGLITELLGEEMAGKLKRGAIIFAGILAFTMFSTWLSVREDRKHEAEDQAREAQSCAKERAMTDHEAMMQCQNAAALFGQDISANPTRLSACVENRENTLAQCTAKGF